MEKFIAILIIIFMTISTIIQSAFDQWLDPGYVRGTEYLGFGHYQDLNAKVESGKFIFSKDMVELDLSISTYDINDEHSYVKRYYKDLETGELGVDRYRYVIYLSALDQIAIKLDENYYVVEYKNIKDAIFIREIGFEEALSPNYGYTTTVPPLSLLCKINYNHTEKINIPKEFFVSDNKPVYIHIIELVDLFYSPGKTAVHQTTKIKIDYYTLDDNTVILLND